MSGDSKKKIGTHSLTGGISAIIAAAGMMLWNEIKDSPKTPDTAIETRLYGLEIKVSRMDGKLDMLIDELHTRKIAKAQD